MGLNDYKEEGTLVWESHSDAAYRNFVEGEPNNMGDEDGMAVCWTFDGKWIDYSNAESLPCLLCEDYADVHQRAALTEAQKKKTDQAQQRHAHKASKEFQKASVFFGKHKLASTKTIKKGK